MSLANLDNLVAIGKLKKEQPDQQEFDGLVRSGAVRLRDAANESLSLESRFDLAYNSAHAFSVAALRFHGYRSENRYLVFQVLEHTVKFPPAKWRILADAHSRRNLVEYEGSADIQEGLVEAILKIAGELETAVRAFGPLPQS